jgi:biopolymer transport protein ExbD
MIDTIFFLLVFFMIASLTMIRMRAIAVALPKNAPTGHEAAGSAVGGDLILTMTERGDYYIGKQHLSGGHDGLQSALQSRFSSALPRDVVLNFSKTRTTQDLISVMDVINRAKSSSGHDIPVLIATAPIDQDGRALTLTLNDKSHGPGGSDK